MRIRLSGIVLVACAAIASAGPLVATPMITAAAASPLTSPAPASRAPAHPSAYVPLRGSKGTGSDRVFTNMTTTAAR